MEELSNSTAPEKIEQISDEIILPKLIQIAKKIYDENWVCTQLYIEHLIF